MILMWSFGQRQVVEEKSDLKKQSHFQQRPNKLRSCRMKDKHAPTIQDLEDLPPFHSAARQGDIDQLSQLLSLHPDLIDYGDGNGYTPLMHAVCASNTDCLKMLLDSGSKPESKDRVGRTALILCALNGWPEGCELIIEYGGSCQTVDSNGRNALHYSSCTHNGGCLELLLQHGSEAINQKDVEGMTPLHWASFHNKTRNVKLLLSNEADSTIVDNEQKTALHWAAQNGCSAACKALIGSKLCKSMIDKKTADSKTALHLAAIAGHLDVIFELTQANGCNADIGDAEGRTALHWACGVGNDRCVAGLLRLGVRHAPVDDFGVTPLSYAKQLGYPSCASLLEGFDPHRPQDVLIPLESLGEMNGSFDRAIEEQSPSSDNDRDMFQLLTLLDKRKHLVDRINHRAKHVSAESYEMQSLNAALGEVLEDNRKQDDRISDSDIASLGDDNRLHDFQEAITVIFDGSTLSEDESRCQPQMAVTPPPGSLDVPRRSKEKKRGNEDGKRNRLNTKKCHSSYKLAPIKSRRIVQQDSLKDLDSNGHTQADGSQPAMLGKMRKISTINNGWIGKIVAAALVVNARGFVSKASKPRNEAISWPLSQKMLGNGARNELTLLERPLGLRRKSLSLNDGFVQYGFRKLEDIPLSRTQSYVQIKTHESRLPTIDTRDGRNLIQNICLDQPDEKRDPESHSFMEHKEMESEKRGSRRKKRVSKQEK